MVSTSYRAHHERRPLMLLSICPRDGCIYKSFARRRYMNGLAA